MDNKQQDQLRSLLSSPKKIVIVTHKNPDGDAIGSSLGLYHILRRAGHHPQVISPNDYPTFLKWLPGDKSVWRYDWTKSKSNTAIREADLIFCLDFNDLHRIEAMGSEVEISNATKILIDHHVNPVIKTQYVYSDPEMVATSQMIYHFTEEMGLLKYIDKAAAECLYTGIMTDSGNFAFPKTSSDTHRIIAHLISLGADNYDIYERIHMNFSASRLHLLAKSLSNITIFPDSASVCMTLTQDELDSCGFKKGDTEGFVNYGLSIKGINVACIFIENRSEGIIKISLRSKGKFSVNEMSNKFFNGAGHINAAGGQLPTTDMTSAISTFEKAIEYYKDQIVESYM